MTVPKVGVIIPTYKRPDLLRQAVLQWIVQSVKPDLLCINQNGSEESYEWVIEDLKPLIAIKWIHVSSPIKQHLWYALSIGCLIAEGCDVILWADHDDIYYRNHVEKKIVALKEHDVTLSDVCGILLVKPTNYKYQPPHKFTAHAPGGMTSSTAFNRTFATTLMLDLVSDAKHYYSDNVLAFVTIPKYRKNITQDITTVYVSHEGSHSSSHWVKDIQP